MRWTGAAGKEKRSFGCLEAVVGERSDDWVERQRPIGLEDRRRTADFDAMAIVHCGLDRRPALRRAAQLEDQPVKQAAKRAAAAHVERKVHPVRDFAALGLKRAVDFLDVFVAQGAGAGLELEVVDD